MHHKDRPIASSATEKNTFAASLHGACVCVCVSVNGGFNLPSAVSLTLWQFKFACKQSKKANKVKLHFSDEYEPPRPTHRLLYQPQKQQKNNKYIYGQLRLATFSNRMQKPTHFRLRYDSCCMGMLFSIRSLQRAAPPGRVSVSAILPVLCHCHNAKVTAL